MMNIRRYYVPEAIVFITQVVAQRQIVFRDSRYIEMLRSTLKSAKARYPFRMLAYVFLPDHFHILIKPSTDVTHSQIMHSIKPNFTKTYKAALGIDGSMSFWQRRYWDHVIRDDIDFERHIHYIHYNPVGHGLVDRPEDWPHSSFHEWKSKGVYAERWGWNLPPELHETDAIQWD